MKVQMILQPAKDAGAWYWAVMVNDQIRAEGQEVGIHSARLKAQNEIEGLLGQSQKSGDAQ